VAVAAQETVRQDVNLEASGGPVEGRGMGDQPQGDNCPGCGQPAMEFGGLGAAMAQRFCSNDQCHVFMWEPDKTLDELMADMQVQGLPDWLAP
jgi:hypothetical protein